MRNSTEDIGQDLLINKTNSCSNVWQSAWLFALALFGYPLIGNAISLFQIDSRLLSVPFRATIVIFCLWLIVNSRQGKFDRLQLFMVFIWILYIFRLLNDWLLVNLEGADYALEFFLASSVLPAFALMRAGVYGPVQFGFIAFVISCGGAIGSLLAAVFGSSAIRELSDESGRLSLTAVDSVSLGHLAASAILCGLAIWRVSTPRTKFVVGCTFVPLSWCLVMTGSKGPAMALVLCVGIWAMRRGYFLWFLTLVIPFIVLALEFGDNALALRLAGSEEDQSTADHLALVANSISQIAGSPFFGSAFVELDSGFYPHNVFIEAPMAMGIPVGILFTGVLLVGAHRSWIILKGDNDLLGLLYFQGLLSASVSGAIFGATLLWVSLAMLPKLPTHSIRVSL